MNPDEAVHVPVMLQEVIEFLITDASGVYFDGTLGDGGYSRTILDRIDKPGIVLATDLDKNAIEFSNEWAGEYSGRLNIFNCNFSQIDSVMTDSGFNRLNGIIIDLGLSTRQLDDPDRGFSYRFSGPLDMSFDPEADVSAEEILNTYTFEQLREIFFKYGEEHRSSYLAKLIIEHREKEQFKSADQLINLMRKRWKPAHFAKSASRIFQALRIAVNNELDSLKKFLKASWEYLVPGGRLVVVSYHSLEDRIVKTFFKDLSNPCICAIEAPICICNKTATARILTKKPLLPTEKEVQENTRARSAKLRAAEKI